MALSLEALKKKVSDLENKNKKPAKSIWKPESEHEVRCLPLEGGEDLAVEKYFHFGIGQHKRVYCPKNDGDDCAICDFAEKMKAWNDDNGKEKPEAKRKADFAIFRELQAAPKHYIPVIVRKSKGSDEFEGPIWWEISPATYKQLCNICVKDDFNEDHPEGGALAVLTSTKYGRDLTVKFYKVGQPGNDTSFPKTTADARVKTSALLSDAKAAQKVLESVPDLNSAIYVQTSAEVAKIFAEFTAGSGDVEDNSTGVERKNSNNGEKLSGTNTPEQAMDKLKDLINKGSKKKEASQEG